MYIRHPIDERLTVWLSFLVFYSRLSLLGVLASTVNDNIPDDSIVSPSLVNSHHHDIDFSLPNPPHVPSPRSPPPRRPLSHGTHHITATFKTRDRDRRDDPIVSAPLAPRLPTTTPTIDDYFRPERSRRSVISKESSSVDAPSPTPLPGRPPTVTPTALSEEPSAWWATEEPSGGASTCRPVESCGKKGKSAKMLKGGIREGGRLRKKRPG